MEGCRTVAKDKTGNASNSKSRSRVREKQRCAVERGGILDSGDAKSGSDGRPRSLVRTVLRRPPGPIQSKVRKFPCIGSLTGLILVKLAFFHGNRWQGQL